MSDDTLSYILQEQVQHYKRQVEYWKEKAEMLEQDNEALREQLNDN